MASSNRKFRLRGSCRPSIFAEMLRRFLLACLILTGAAAAHALPSDEMFEKLRNAPSDSEANDASLDIWASWQESGSATVDVIMERAGTAQALGDYSTARALYDRAILIEPDYSEAWYRRAALFLNEENYAEALSDLNETLRIEPRHFGAWASLGVLFETMGANREALDAYREAIRIYPRMPQALQAEKRLSKLAEGQGL